MGPSNNHPLRLLNLPSQSRQQKADPSLFHKLSIEGPGRPYITHWGVRAHACQGNPVGFISFYRTGQELSRARASAQTGRSSSHHSGLNPFPGPTGAFARTNGGQPDEEFWLPKATQHCNCGQDKPTPPHPTLRSPVVPQTQTGTGCRMPLDSWD